MLRSAAPKARHMIAWGAALGESAKGTGRVLAKINLGSTGTVFVIRHL